MAWLASGVAYSVAYILVGWLLHGHAHLLLAFRVSALLVPPMTGVIVIARRRSDWTGCHWLFWATIALGLTMSAIGLIGWTVDELLLARCSPCSARPRRSLRCSHSPTAAAANRSRRARPWILPASR